jgi:hypothetical protein
VTPKQTLAIHFARRVCHASMVSATHPLTRPIMASGLRAVFPTAFLPLLTAAGLWRCALTPVASVVVIVAAERLFHAVGNLGGDLRDVTDRIPHRRLARRAGGGCV